MKTVIFLRKLCELLAAYEREADEQPVKCVLKLPVYTFQIAWNGERFLPDPDEVTDDDYVG